MAGEGLFCAACGITLRPFMKICPRCGQERENAEPIEIPPHSPKARSDPANSTGSSSLPPPFVPGQADSPQSNLQQQPERIYLPPDETTRRFPALTSAQRALMAI
ncbi:MAG: hypothetical protein J2P31_03610, partial [Blastocatellia bacterium]|nr:hypothetical protein [Blastocatellia bacterium]